MNGQTIHRVHINVKAMSGEPDGCRSAAVTNKTSIKEKKEESRKRFIGEPALKRLSTENLSVTKGLWMKSNH